MTAVAAATALVLAMAGCQSRAVWRRDGSSRGRTNVVTTTTVFADIVANVGGARVTASSIIPAGVGPEDFEPKPDDAKTAQRRAARGLERRRT